MATSGRNGEESRGDATGTARHSRAETVGPGFHALLADAKQGHPEAFLSVSEMADQRLSTGEIKRVAGYFENYSSSFLNQNSAIFRLLMMRNIPAIASTP